MTEVEEVNHLLGHGAEYDESQSCNVLDDAIEGMSDWNALSLALCLAMGNAADAVEILCVGFIMTDIDSEITSSNKEYLSSSVFMGMLFGGVLCGYISDIVGRRKCLLFSLLLNSMAGILSALVPTVEGLIVCRVIGGLGIGGSVPIVFSLGAEVFPSTVRGKYLSVIASFWMVGALYTAFFAWIMLGNDLNGYKILPGVHWRAFAIVCALPAIAAFVLTFAWVPESPRYLYNQRRYEEAAATLKSLTGRHVHADDLRHYRELPSSSISQVGIKSVTTTSSFSTSPSSSYSGFNTGNISSGSSSGQNILKKLLAPVAVLFSRHLVRKTCVLLLIWFTLSFGSYGISTWISLLFFDVGITNIYASSFIFAIANLPGNYFSIQYMDKLGGRRLLFYGMCLSAVSVLGFAFDTTQPVVVVLSASLFNCFSVIGWNSLDCLSVEYFPTRVRTSAMGSLAAAGRLGAICAEFVNGSLEANIPALLIVTSGCTVLGGLAAWLLPGEPLETSLLGADGTASYEQLRTSSRASSREASPQSDSGAYNGRRQMQMAALGVGVDGIDGSELSADDTITS